VSLEARANGIFGRVEWTATGKSLLADKAYRFLSPVIRHLADGTVTGILRAALTNTPNLRGMAALHNEGTNMDLLATLRETIGLAADANEAACIAAVAALKEKPTTAAQAALAPIAKAEATAILAAVTTLATADAAKAGDQVKALQSELATVAGTDGQFVLVIGL